MVTEHQEKSKSALFSANIAPYRP